MDARNAGAIALSIISVVLRLCAIALCCIVVLLCFSGLTARLNMTGFIVDLSRAIPSAIAGWGVITSPFGGVFRLDFALVAGIFFLLDYVCARVSYALRS